MASITAKKNKKKSLPPSPPSSPSRSPKPLAFDAVIFDIDNVLVDTRSSYLEVIRWTVDLFLTTGKVPFFSSDPKGKISHLLSPDDVAQFKLLGGFNDDWDCCYGLLTYLLSLKPNGHRMRDLKKAIQIREFVEKVKIRPLGVSGITKLLGRNFYVLIEKISRIFQEVYLGKDLFERIEKIPAQYWIKRGLIHKEKLIFRKSTLQKLKAMGVKMGITTGRSRFEAIYALRHFGIESYFDAITTMDEIRPAEEAQKQSLRKPHPYSLIETAKKMGAHRRFLYIGDLPDDILTAKRAQEKINVKAVGFPAFSHDPKTTLAAMQKQKADTFLDKPSEIVALVKKGF